MSKSKVQSTKEVYDVFFVKRDPATLSFKVKKGQDENGQAIDVPVAGEKIRTLTMHESNAVEYNMHWESTGKFMQLSKAKEAAQPVAQKQPQNSSLKDEFPDVYAMSKTVLVSNLESFALSIEGNVGVLKARLAQYLNDNK